MVNKLILRVCVCVERSSNAKMEENMKKETLGKLFLLTAALIWGSSFVVMKSAVDFITPFVLLFIRFTLSTLFMSCLFFKKIKMILIDHQAQGEKYNSDNSKILDNFSESIGKDFVMYFEIFSIICVPVYL